MRLDKPRPTDLERPSGSRHGSIKPLKAWKVHFQVCAVYHTNVDPKEREQSALFVLIHKVQQYRTAALQYRETPISGCFLISL